VFGVPSVSEVALGVGYGANDIQFIGTLTGAVCDYPDESDVRLGIVYADGGMEGTLLVPTVPDPAGQLVLLMNTYDENGQPEDGAKTYHRLKLPPPNVAIYDDTPKENISAGGITTFLNMFKRGIYEFWRGRSNRVTMRIPETGTLGITAPQNFEAMVVEQTVHLTWTAAFEAEFFLLSPIIGNDSLDPCAT
jgi:hypothetical protein